MIQYGMSGPVCVVIYRYIYIQISILCSTVRDRSYKERLLFRPELYSFRKIIYLLEFEVLM